MPIYSCITVSQALLRTVSFRFNGTNDLSGLTGVDIADKVYSGEETMPLWGVENIGNTTGMTLHDVKPIWDLISPDLTTRQLTLRHFGRLRCCSQAS